MSEAPDRLVVHIAPDGSMNAHNKDNLPLGRLRWDVEYIRKSALPVEVEVQGCIAEMDRDADPDCEDCGGSGSVVYSLEPYGAHRCLCTHEMGEAGAEIQALLRRILNVLEGE